MFNFYLITKIEEKEMIANDEAQVIMVALGLAKVLRKKLSSWKNDEGFTCLNFGSKVAYIKYKI